MNVLHISHTPIAGAPGLLSRALNSYGHRSRNIVGTISNGRGDYSCDYQDALPPEEWDEEIAGADIIHFHNTCPSEWHIEGKPFVIQLHSEPAMMGRLIHAYPKATFLTLAQKHIVLYRKFLRRAPEVKIRPVPHILPIFEEPYLPDGHAIDRLHILYAPTSVEEYPDYDSCRGKGYNETIRILGKIQNEFGVKVTVMMGYPKHEVLRVKRTADIVIDECVTGGYHLASLEALSMNCVPIAHISDEVRGVIAEISGMNWHPWLSTDLSGLEQRLARLISIHWVKSGREWMEACWHPRRLIRHYTDAYEEAHT